jgi:acyl carrier protein
VTRDEVLERIRAMMVDMFDVDGAKVVPDARLVEDLDLDSIDAIDLVAKLHELTGQRVEEAELRQLRSIKDVLDLVERQLATKPV